MPNCNLKRCQETIGECEECLGFPDKQETKESEKAPAEDPNMITLLNEIEAKVACHELDACQTFTQMKQLINRGGACHRRRGG